jgi:hypothetical protein
MYNGPKQKENKKRGKQISQDFSDLMKSDSGSFNDPHDIGKRQEDFNNEKYDH